MSEAEAEIHSTTTFSTLERQAAALCTIFQLAAERDADSGDQMPMDTSQESDDSELKISTNLQTGSGSGSGAKKLSNSKMVLYMRRLIYLLSISSPSQIPDLREDTIGKLARRVSIDPAEKSTYAYAAANVASPDHNPQFDVFKLSPLDTMTSKELDKLSKLSEEDAVGGKSIIAPVVVKALLDLEASCRIEPSLKEYVGLLCGMSNFLPGFQQLSMLACCTFGVKPLVPELEKLYIIDLTLSRQDEFPQTRECPNGPIGTEWSVLSSAWLNSWRFFVGHKRRGGSVRLSDSAIKDQLAKEDVFKEHNINGTKRARRKSGGVGGQPIIKNVVNAVLPMTFLSSVLKPFGDDEKLETSDDLPSSSTDSHGDPTEVGHIDNFSIVRKKPALTIISGNDSNFKNSFDESELVSNLVTTTAPVLVPGLDISQHLELVPPDVFKTLFLWYGGGPEITRKVILNEIDKPELELYPLRIRICRCDPNGNPSAEDREFLFSKMTSIGDVIKGVCSYYRSADGSAKLWDYATTDWKTQKLLSDMTMTLASADIVDGQLLLLEISLGNGTWPRSQRQSEMEAELANANGKRGSLHTSNSLTSLVSASNISAGGGLMSRKKLTNVPRISLNKGRVGIDNLGNTCYMSSSLQVLLHTDQLVEYFMRKAYLKHVNIHSRHGYKGRLAHAFGKLVADLWCTDKSSVTPRNFRAELSQIREEFAGNEQHDAQELMIFLLDGLSEDVNLVQDKPYIENPDSDDRSDEELADIWWANHMKRENSVIQSLFTGQFKSVMRCSNCNHVSARFEPFNSLALPLLEDQTRTVCVDVVTLGCQFRVQQCVVTVKRTDTLQAVVDKIVDEQFGILGLASAAPHFLAADTFDSKVREFHALTREVSNILSNETVTLYEIITPYPAEEDKSTETPTPGSNLNTENVVSAQPTVDNTQVDDGMDLDQNSSPQGRIPNSGDDVGELQDVAATPTPVDAGVARVVVLQRRAKSSFGGGLSTFSLEPIGLPIVDVINKQVAASDIYSMVSSKLKHCLKAPLDLLLHDPRTNGANRHGVKGGLGTSSEASFSSNRSGRGSGNSTSSTPTGASLKDSSSVHSISDLRLYYDVGSEGSESGQVSSRSSFDTPSVPAIRPVEIEEAVAKDISTYGFVLRYVRPDGVSCSKCPWIHGCQGCLLPDSPDLMITVDDGTVFAADWHYVVYHELIESAGVSRGDILHPSMENTKKERNVPKIALSSCLDKFMEEEKLEGIVCPKCHEDSHLSKNFVLWRLPPVLFVQLKRFQFDRFSRRKLNDLVDFPVENLDLAPYLAAGSPHVKSEESAENKKMENNDVNNCCCLSGGNMSAGHMCSQYSLYAVVHHVGIMGGGHYVASVRDNSESMEALYENVHASTAVQQGLDLDETATQETSQPPAPQKSMTMSKQWWCYNDSTVTPIKEEEIISPSAYLLFYMRNDIARGTHKLEDIFKYAESMDEAVLLDEAGRNDSDDNNSGDDSSNHGGGAKHEATDDVSTRRGRKEMGSVGAMTAGEVASSADTSSPTGAKRTPDGGKGSSARKVGYTEEEFEKIMQNGGESSQQCQIS